MKMTHDSNLDTVLLEGIESLEQYLNEHQVSCDTLKHGFLMLTKAKLRLSDHILSEISYREEFKASYVVTMDSDGKWRLQNALMVEALDAKIIKRQGAKLRHRRTGTSYQNEDQVSETSNETAFHSDTLLWFSSLPPSDLRQAQKQFLNGLQAMLVAAASAQKVQKAVHGVMAASR